jgi:hypothetical protein
LNSLVLSAQYEDPLSVFLYALKAPETKRQYPRRLKVFLDFLKLDGTLEQQSKEFLARAKQNPQWAQHSLMQLLDEANRLYDRLLHHFTNTIMDNVTGISSNSSSSCPSIKVIHTE